MVGDKVEEDSELEEEESGQEYLSFDIESRQDEGRHVVNLLIVQYETGFELVFKEACNSSFGLGVYLLKSKFRIEDKLRFP